VELAHGLRHVGLVALLRRVSGARWSPADGSIGEKKEAE
jgi:hypothetical protein